MTIKGFKSKYGDLNEFVFRIILKNITSAFISKCLEIEMNSVKEQISQMKKDDFIYNVNGFDKVNWSKYENMISWDMTADEQATADRTRKTLSKCEHLLYTRNILIRVSQL